MNFKVNIKDYQIIKKASLEFIPGLNVIVGPSNNGKSSILKAIKACIYTVPGANPIRAGQNQYLVGIEYNGHTVILQKGLKESVYIVDGEKYTKYGTTTPKVVSDALGLKELVLNNNKEILNYCNQMDYPFLIDRTSVELFRFIVDSGENDRVSDALKSMVSDRQSISKDINLIQGGIDTVDLEIKSYKDKLDKSKEIIDTCNSIIKLQPLVAKLNLMKNIKESCSKILSDLSKTNEELVKKSNILDIYTNFNKSITGNNNKYCALVDKFNILRSIIENLSTVESKINSLKIILSLSSIDTSGLNLRKEILNKINYINNELKSLKSQPSAKFDISNDTIERYFNLKNIKDKLIDFDNQKIRLEDSKLNCDNSIELYKELKLLFDFCPYCGSGLSTT
jgi:exonuclease SbcC